MKRILKKRPKIKDLRIDSYESIIYHLLNFDPISNSRNAIYFKPSDIDMIKSFILLKKMNPYIPEVSILDLSGFNVNEIMALKSISLPPYKDF